MSEYKCNVFFADTVLTDELQIFEVTEDLINDLVQGKPIVLRGQPEDDSVLCTKSKTYQVRSVENSNTCLMVDMSTYREKHGDAMPTTEHPYIITGSSSKIIELAEINPLTYQLSTRLADHVIQKSHDRYVMKTLDATDAETRMRRRMQMSDDTINELLGEDDWPSKIRKRVRKEEDDLEAEENDEYYDDMFDTGTAATLSPNQGESIGSKRGRADTVVNSLPAGLTRADLLNCIQASEDELDRALRESDEIIALPQQYWGVESKEETLRYLLVDSALHTKAVDALLDIIVSHGYDLECVPLMDIIREMRRDSVCSIPLVYHAVRALQSNEEREKSPLLIPVPGRISPRELPDATLHASPVEESKLTQQDDGFEISTQIITTDERELSGRADLDISRVILVRLDAKKIAIHRATQLLQSKSPYPVREFMSDWKFSVPPGVEVSENLLSGLALRTQMVVGMDAVSSAPGPSPTNKTGTRVDAFEYFPRSKLSHIPKQRFTQLFTHRREWTKEEITPYVQDLILKSLAIDQLLLREARAIRSTTLPPQPDGTPTTVYTWR